MVLSNRATPLFAIFSPIFVPYWLARSFMFTKRQIVFCAVLRSLQCNFHSHVIFLHYGRWYSDFSDSIGCDVLAKVSSSDFVLKADNTEESADIVIQKTKQPSCKYYIWFSFVNYRHYSKQAMKLSIGSGALTALRLFSPDRFNCLA